MTHKELSKFTHGELKNFTHAELSLDFSELLDILKSENRSIPVETYEKLKALADRYNVQMPEQPKHKLSTKDKIDLVKAIIALLAAIIKACNPGKPVTYNHVEINVYLSTPAPTSDDALSSLCDCADNLIIQRGQ